MNRQHKVRAVLPQSSGGTPQQMLPLGSHPGVTVPQVSGRMTWHVPWAASVKWACRAHAPTKTPISGVTSRVTFSQQQQKQLATSNLQLRKRETKHLIHSTGTEQNLVSSYDLWLFVYTVR